jgi:peptidoglycan/LPS O-acetylase OafA/YrhL
MINFLNGVAMAGALGVGLFFFRLWHDTRDRFFALFGLAFWMMAFSWFLLVWATSASEDRHYFYLGRLLAFLLILAAIVDKNRSSGRPRP